MRNHDTIDIFRREVSVCLFFCSDLEAKLPIGWISTKFGLGHALVSVGNLKIFFC